VKIDGNFVRDLTDDKFDRAIVQSIHDVASAMGIQTIAEFVENQDILNALRGMGVHYAQGYGIAKPKPLADEQLSG
jgi:EAL domain-containing protein (putative c-di-GMP-specific phosphodiesterase class I)